RCTAVRNAEARRARPGARVVAAFAVAGRTGRRAEPRGGSGACRLHSPSARRVRADDSHRRAPHGPRDGCRGSRPRARLRQEDRGGHTGRRARKSGRDRGVPRYGGMIVLAFTWSEFAEQVTSGLASGAVYASLALALVLIYRTTRALNFAQGAMATFTTLVAWSLMNHGLSFWEAFPIVLAIAFAGGIAIERVLIRPV